MASLLEKIRWVVTDPDRRRSVVAWYGAHALRRPPVLTLPAGGRLSHFVSYREYWDCRSRVPDPRRCALLRRVVRPGGVVLDVGAGAGIFSITVGKLVGGAVVYGFEPDPFAYETLARNVAANKLPDVHPLNLGVSDVAGRAGFRIDGSPPTEVTVTTIDSFCEGRGVDRCDLVRIDAGGAEPRVLAGARRALTGRRLDCVLIEVCPSKLAAKGSSVTELCAAAYATGHGFFGLTGEGRPGHRLTADHLAALGRDHLLMLPL